MLEKTNYANVSLKDLQALLEIRTQKIKSLFSDIRSQCNMVTQSPGNPKIVDDGSKKIESYISEVKEARSDIKVISKEIWVSLKTHKKENDNDTE